MEVTCDWSRDSGVTFSTARAGGRVTLHLPSRTACPCRTCIGGGSEWPGHHVGPGGGIYRCAAAAAAYHGVASGNRIAPSNLQDIWMTAVRNASQSSEHADNSCVAQETDREGRYSCPTRFPAPHRACRSLLERAGDVAETKWRRQRQPQATEPAATGGMTSRNSCSSVISNPTGPDRTLNRSTTQQGIALKISSPADLNRKLQDILRVPPTNGNILLGMATLWGHCNGFSVEREFSGII